MVAGSAIVMVDNQDIVDAGNVSYNTLKLNPPPIDQLAFNEIKKLVASDGVASDYFGYSISLSGDTVIVGARNHDVGGNEKQGSAYIFEQNEGGEYNWGEVTKLVASDGASGDEFGRSVSIHGDTVVVSAFIDDIDGNTDQGSAYIFERNAGGVNNWGEVTKLTASDGAPDDIFGLSVSLSNDILAVGAPYAVISGNIMQGSAYIFERNMGGADNWGEVTKLISSDGVAGDYFGYSVSMFNDTLAVGAIHAEVGGNADQGSVYVFERNMGGADNWGEVTKIVASDGGNGDSFGYSISIFNDILAVGAERADAFRGSAYIFDRNTGGADNWGQVSKLTASDGAASDYFGESICISNDTLIVGAYAADIGVNIRQGAAYLFERNAGGADNWGQVNKLIASDGAASDYFGRSVCISDETLVVSAYSDDFKQGSAYIFSLHIEPMISLLSPANNSVITSGTIIDIEVTGSHFINVNYSVNGGLNTTLPAPYDIDTTLWADGSYMIEVHANNTPDNNISSSYNFIIDSSAPEIIHQHIISTPTIQSVNITANITDIVGVNEVYLNYTDTNGMNHNASMNQWGGNWSYDIPAQNSLGFVDYFIWCDDLFDYANQTPIYHIQIIEPFSIADIEPDSIALPIYPNWNLISIPREPLDKGSDGKFTAFDLLREIQEDLGVFSFSVARHNGGIPSSYTVFDSGTMEGAFNDFEITNTDAYWLYAPAVYGMVNIESQDIANWGIDNVKVLDAGWNMLGFPHNNSVGGAQPGGWNTQLRAHHFTDGTIDPDLVVGVVDQDMIIATRWIPTTHQYESYLVNTTFSGIASKDWYYDSYYSIGYWLWVENSVEVTFDTEF